MKYFIIIFCLILLVSCSTEEKTNEFEAIEPTPSFNAESSVSKAINDLIVFDTKGLGIENLSNEERASFTYGFLLSWNGYVGGLNLSMTIEDQVRQYSTVNDFSGMDDCFTELNETFCFIKYV
jgi:hypothetical protein